MLSVTLSRTEGADVIALRGELDMDSVVQLREAAEQLAEPPEEGGLVVADCAQLAFCDSSGISGFIALHQRLAARGGSLCVAAAPRSVVRVFTLTGIDQVIPLHDDLDQALGRRTPRTRTATTGEEAR